MLVGQAPTSGLETRQIVLRWATALTGLIGLAVLLGWAADWPALRSVVPGAVEMKVNTAVGLVVAAAALMLATRANPGPLRAGADLLALFLALLGLATLVEYAFGVNFGIDELLARDTGAAFNSIKGRMSPYSAATFVALGVAIFSVSRPRRWSWGRGASTAAVAIGTVSVIGYLWGATEIVGDRVAPPVAVHTAVAFMLLGVAAIAWLWPGGDARRGVRTRLETLVLGGFVPTVLLALVGGGITYESGASFGRAAERVAHTQEVRAELGALRAAIGDAESARNDYVLTGDAGFDAKFQRQAADVRRHVVRLGGLIADNPSQVQRQQALATLTELQLRAYEAVIETYRQSGPDAARGLVVEDVRSGGTSRADALIMAMDQAESALLAERLRAFEARRTRTLVALLVTFAGLVAIFGVLFRMIRAEVRSRERAEGDLHDLNARLEQRIKARTAELTHQQAFLRRVIDLDPNLIFAKDADGRFVLANEALAQSYKTSVDALIGRTELELGRDDVVARANAAADLHVIRSGAELAVKEQRAIDAEGRERWFSTVKRPILSPDGSATIALGVAVDITERVEREHQIRELNAELEQRVEERTSELRESNVLLKQARLDSEAASRAKSAFLANMSHEIRTPMNAVIGLTHLMLREASDSVQRDRLGKVGDAARHLLQVINDILDMSKIEAGKMQLEQIEFSLVHVLGGAMGMVNSQARDKRLELILDNDHVPERVIGDPTRLSQILINLLSNAVKFTEYGWVRLRTHVQARDGVRLQLRFEVQDTGPGIPADLQAGLFSAFEQADASTSRQHGGTGLGLALSRQLARAMDGEADVVSAPGSGSMFWFTAWVTMGAQATARAPLPSSQRLRALVVDDLPEALSVIGECLQSLGLQVDACNSGAAALERARAETAAGRPHDVLVIDWRMEPMDGLETLRRLRRLLGEGTPPAILVTAYDDATLAGEARAIGYGAVLVKPVTVATMQEGLANVLSRAAATAPVSAATPEGEALVRSSHAGQRVLLAEDNAVNREVAESLLGTAGLVVESAADGARAVELALSRHYDLILMDVQMPVLDGLEATRAIRARLGHALPIIAMTANAFAEDRSASIDAGMNDHVTKPVDPGDLYAALLRWLPLRKSVPPDAPTSDFGALPGSDQRRRLAAISELDLDLALRHVAGQMSALERTLRRFITTYAEGLPALADAAADDAGLRLRWGATCHSVRGALGTIGATALLAEVSAMQQALSTDVPVRSLAPAGLAIHRHLLDLVARLERAVDTGV